MSHKSPPGGSCLIFNVTNILGGPRVASKDFCWPGARFARHLYRCSVGKNQSFFRNRVALRSTGRVGGALLENLLSFKCNSGDESVIFADPFFSGPKWQFYRWITYIWKNVAYCMADLSLICEDTRTECIVKTERCWVGRFHGRQLWCYH